MQVCNHVRRLRIAGSEGITLHAGKLRAQAQDAGAAEGADLLLQVQHVPQLQHAVLTAPGTSRSVSQGSLSRSAAT